MNIYVLTSSRADYGIYLPLLKKINKDPYFKLYIIAFGTHLSSFHGYSLNFIKADGFDVAYKVDSLILGDNQEAISSSIGLTTLKFSSIWAEEKCNINLILALGDRFEMFAALAASIPFNIPIAHIHGGETTLGAIDNTFRHTISLMSSYHFTSTQIYADKVSNLIGSKNNIFNVGALSLDNIEDMSLLSKQEFYQKYNIDINKPTILTTFHPETVTPELNIQYTNELIETLDFLKSYQIIITMPNADTMGNTVREMLINFISKNNDRVYGIETFGTLGYFSCMQHCSFLIGNTSSGIIEAASFDKYVINIGDRQKGRACSMNTFSIDIKKENILKCVKQIESFSFFFEGKNIYRQGNVSNKIINRLKEINGNH